jgi:uncharacterized protein involved in cysteine biosynthesis
MPQVFFALFRSFASFGRPGLARYLVLPPLVAGVLWLFAAFWWLGALTDWLVAATPLSWLHATLVDWHLAWIATALGFVGAWIVLFSGAYLIAVTIAGVWALPAIVRSVAVTDYPDVTPRGNDSVVVSVAVTLKAVVLYLAGWIVTLPVWLVPGMAVVHSFFWLAWLNRATFAFDALAAHASTEEWRLLKQRHGARMWLLGLMAAFLAHVPLLGFFAPALAAMSYVHFGLQALREERGTASPGFGMPGVRASDPGHGAAIDGEFRRE